MKTWVVSLRTDDPQLYVVKRCTTAHQAWSAASGQLPGSPSFAEVRCVCLVQDVLGAAEVRVG